MKHGLKEYMKLKNTSKSDQNNDLVNLRITTIFNNEFVKDSKENGMTESVPDHTVLYRLSYWLALLQAGSLPSVRPSELYFR